MNTAKIIVLGLLSVAPHRVFHLGLDALVDEKPIAKAAKHVGWRAQLVDRKKHPIAGAELAITSKGLRFACISRGPHATDTDKREAVADWGRRVKGDHELALLRIPGAYCTAFWLRSGPSSPSILSRPSHSILRACL